MSTQTQAEQNKQLVRRMVEEVQDGHALHRMETFFDPNFINHLDHAPDSPLNSVAKAQQVFRTLFAAFPDLHVTIQSQIAEGDKVVTHKIFHGTHQGEFAGAAPTGKRIEFPVIDILRVAEGKIVEHWAVQDRTVMLQQLGLMPTQG